jgi:hypothetical protein
MPRTIIRKYETMKTIAMTVTALLMLVGALLANDEAVAVSKAHMNAFLQSDYKKLEDTYASKVVLMPGHEFLKVGFGFATEPGRKQAMEVERAKVIQALTKASEGRPTRPADQIAAMMESLRFEVIKTTPGDFVMEASRPVATPDSKLHFTIKEGDVLVKATPPRGGFVLLQLRQADGAWRVVGEYLD